MASLTGAVFDEYSSLEQEEKHRAAECVGETVSFVNDVPASDDKVWGGKENDIFHVDSEDADIHDTGGTDIVVTSVDYEMGAGIEHLIMTGDESLAAEGNTLDNVMAGNGGDNLIDGRQGDDKIFAGDGSDTVRGGSGRDTLDGGSGADTIDGGAGADTITGGEGADSIIGGSGSDILDGGAGADTIIGDGGGDTIIGGSGDDVLTGGAGHDVFYFEDASGVDQITDFDPSRDVIHIMQDINGTGIDTAEDVLARVSADGLGNTLIDLGNGHMITLQGIDPDSLDADMFVIQ